MSDREKFDLIERYIAGKLTASEQDTFQKLWATDPDFVEEVNYHELVNDFIIDAGLLEVKQKLSKYTNAKKPPKPNFFKKVVGKTQNLVIASIMLIMTGFGIGLWVIQQPFNNAVNKQSPPKAENTDSSGPKAHPKSKINRSIKTDKPKTQKNSAIKSDDSKRQSSAPNQGSNNSLNGSKSANLSYKKSDKTSLNKIERLSYSSSLGALSNSTIVEKTRPESNLSISIKPSLKEKLAKSTCEETEIKGEVEAVPSCKDKINGKLKVITETIEGGKPPYSYKLSRNTRFSNKTVHSKLGKGTYIVEVKDNQGCIDTLASKIKIHTEQCGKRSFTYVPEQETRWKYPFKDKPSGRIKIFHEGKEVYNNRINQGIPVGWNGRFNNGQKASMGLYRVIFSPHDGQPKIWLLTVIR